VSDETECICIFWYADINSVTTFLNIALSFILVTSSFVVYVTLLVCRSFDVLKSFSSSVLDRYLNVLVYF